VVSYCAAIAAKADGDARVAIDLLKTAADIAERNGDKVVTDAHVKSAKNSLEYDLISEAIRTLPSHSKMVLISIIKNHEIGNRSMTTGDVYKSYCYIADIIGVSPLTQRRVGDLINELDSLGIVTASVCSFGRAGRTKVIELSIDKHVIDGFKTNNLYKTVEDYKPLKQTRLM
jgi:cell division control protein 6